MSDNYLRCYQSAIRLLARREHSRLELINKLRRKEFAEAVNLDALCDQLEKLNYLSNTRFAAMFVYSRINRGQGEIKIRYVLQQRGIQDALIASALSEAEVDWFELAKGQREKRFGKEMPIDFKQRAKQYRFLASRGFSAEIIRSVFN